MLIRHEVIDNDDDTHLAGQAFADWLGYVLRRPIPVLVVVGARPAEGPELPSTDEIGLGPLDRAQIRRYVELDRPIGSAGGYLFEKHGPWLFDDVRYADETAIVGLPLVPLCRLLRRFGVEPLDVPARA